MVIALVEGPVVSDGHVHKALANSVLIMGRATLSEDFIDEEIAAILEVVIVEDVVAGTVQTAALEVGHEE